MENKSDGVKSRRSRIATWNGPRTVIIPRTERGFGFTLRHFIVYPPEPDAFIKEREYTSDDETEDYDRLRRHSSRKDEHEESRMEIRLRESELYFQKIQQGNLDPLDTIFVKNVKDGGPAHRAGLNPGDRIISVNGEAVTGKSYGQVIKLIQSSSSDLSLLVVPKEEDILQLAYQNTTQAFDSDYGHVRESAATPLGGGRSSVKVSQYPSYGHQASMDSGCYASSSSSRDRKVLSTSSLDSHLTDSVDSSFGRFDHESPRKSLTSSTSYTSGLSIYRDPKPDDTMNKAVFLDRRREFETRAAQENVNPNSAKSYSFGLYFPKKESQVNSAENLSKSVVIRRSRENVLQPTDSQENIPKMYSSRTRNIPVEYRHSGTPDQRTVERFRSQDNLGHEAETKTRSQYGPDSSIRHSFPDSGGVQIWSSPKRRTSETSSPYGFEHGTPTPESSANKRDSYTAGRQYVPVINQSAISRNQMSASVDSIDPRSNIFHSEHHLRTAYNSNNNSSTPSSSDHAHQNQSSPSRTVIVKIGDHPQDRSGTPSITHSASGQGGNHSYGAAFALTRSTAAEIEIRQKTEPRILVSHRKKQFEKSRNDNITPPSSSINQIGRYKSEIDKISTFRKYDGVQARLASFEKSGGPNMEPMPRSRSQTPVSAQPITKVRRMSQERIKSPEPSSNQNTQITQGNSQSNFSDSAPIRIYVSQGNSSSSGSPIVEIVPMQSSGYEIADGMVASPYGGHGSQAEVGRDLRDSKDDGGQKPVRKASFLSAVNAPYSRYLPQTGYDNEISPPPDMTPKSSRVAYPSSKNLSRDRKDTKPTNFQWAGRSPSPAHALSAHSPLGTNSSSITISSASSPIPHGATATTTVRLRPKPEISAEDYETKLHRRTSYLMATAKDRSAVSLTMAPNSPTPIDPNTPGTLNKHKSMRKLKDFFGEKVRDQTPKIAEATERKQDPASPIQQVTREGGLGVKVDMIDGKRASDRSWRPVWAVLRGHCLFLCKEKRDPANQTSLFSYDEQPISIKSCIVDIAHSYTKRKNVFRMKTYNGSEYLLQADDHEDMLAWIVAIKSNSDPDSDANGVTNAELIIRKSHELESAAVMTTKTSPPPSQKVTKKLSVLSIKQKIPHSPNLKRRKTTSDKDDSGKPKTWKGKIGKSFKKQFGSSPSPVGSITPVQEAGGMFGVPLEDCTPSPNNEFVPLIVDLCTQIVEAKGLEMTGVYRIPGNKAAVTLLQEEFNKGIESMNLEHEKWSDVNVISSLLKSFFRQLPESLVTDELYQPLIDANRIDDPERRMLKLKRLMHELPEHHFETFKHLAKHLNKVAQYGDVNRMEGKNLAIVFGPTLIRKADDNMVAMFTDMSDHCKIIESIVLHCDWFFGSWDMDNYVPTDDDATECTSITSAMTSSTREDLDNISINPREIVSSIVEAAHRKLRGDHQMSEKRSISVSEPPTKFNERNIDQEIVLRTRKIDSTSRSSPNLAAMQRASDIIKTAAGPQEITPDSRRMAKSQELCDRDYSDFEYMDSEKDNSSAYLTPTTRYFSDDSLLEKNDELELSHTNPGQNYRLSRETLDSLRRIEMEARALREREERRQRDQKILKLEKQRIEQDILQTQHELEIEDRHSVEDLLHTQDYSQYSANPDQYKRKIETGGYRNMGGGDSRNTVSSGTKHREGHSGGKYFVIKGNTPSSYDRSSRPPRQASVESLVKQSKRTSSLENMSESQSKSRGHSRPQAHVRARKGDTDRSKRDSTEIKRRSTGLGRSNSMRRGSLDSLIDLIEKRDNRMSWASTDSDEGLDLLTTLTSTFDQKLQKLSSPKSQPSQPPPPPRRAVYSSSNSSLSTNTSGPDSGDSSSHNAQHRLPPQVPLSMVQRQSNSSTEVPAKQYRDPSLHRTPPKPDTKIGLATRFERTTTHNPMYQSHSGSDGSSYQRNSYGINIPSDVTFSLDNSSLANARVIDRNDSETRLSSSNNVRGVGERVDSESRVSSVMVVISSPSVMSADSRQSGGYSVPVFVPKPVMSSLASVMSSSLTPNSPKWELQKPVSPTRTEYRPISKSEKTEVNVKLSQNLDKNKNAENSFKMSSMIDSLTGSVKSRSASPPPYSRKRSEKKNRRRHTVGGTNDTEHMSAISDATRKDGGRPSAWEQLQPAVSQASNIGPNSSLLSWLQNERLRGSSPDLSSRADKNSAKRN